MIKLTVVFCMLIVCMLCVSSNPQYASVVNNNPLRLLDKDFMWLGDGNIGIKKITITKNDTVGIIQLFNKAGLPYFIKNSEFNGKGIIAIWYLDWNIKNQLDKSIYAHSNLGYQTKINVMEGNHCKTYSFQLEEDKLLEQQFYDNVDSVSVESLNNFGYLQELSKINNVSTLLESDGYLKSIEKKKYLNSFTIYDKEYKEIYSKWYNCKGTLEGSCNREYKRSKVVTKYTYSAFGIHDSSTEEYNAMQQLVLSKKSSNTIHYAYENNLMRKKTEFLKGKVSRTTSYIYNKGLLTEEIENDVEKGTKYLTFYTYNTQGKIASKVSTTNEGVQRYQYSYEYW